MGEKNMLCGQLSYTPLKTPYPSKEKRGDWYRARLIKLM